MSTVNLSNEPSHEERDEVRDGYRWLPQGCPVEQFASHAVTALSNLGELGTYIETWAVKD